MDDESAIRELVATWLSASQSGDSATILGLMTDDAVFLVPGREPFGKSDFAQMAQAQVDSSLKIDGKSEILELRVLGDWAYMVSRLSITIRQPEQKPAGRAGHTLTLFRKQGGKWQLARDANLVIPVGASVSGA